MLVNERRIDMPSDMAQRGIWEQNRRRAGSIECSASYQATSFNQWELEPR